VEGKDPKWRPTISSQLFFLLTPPTKIEQTECSEISAYKIQTPGYHPIERIQCSEQRKFEIKKKNFCSIRQHEDQHRKYKRLKLGGGQVYIYPVYSAVVTAKAK
jgi:hypothetical protein